MTVKALTLEDFIKLVDELDKPPVIAMTSELAKMLEDAVASWEAKGTARDDIEGIMLIIPWKVSTKQTLDTSYGPLSIHFSKYAPFATFLPQLKAKWLSEPMPYKPLKFGEG